MTIKPHVVFIDGANFMHRARSGFTLGSRFVCFNFFRNLRALVEALRPSRIVFALEGHPKARHAALPEYKANRVIDATTEEGEKQFKSLQDFHFQAGLIVELLSKCFPVSVIVHDDHEGDDTIYNVIKRGSTAVPVTVVSSDSDFIQLLQEFEHVTLYNPISKMKVGAPQYDYVYWKALRGDASDNVPAIDGLTDETAAALIDNPQAFEDFLSESSHASEFVRNTNLIRFATWSDEEAMSMRCNTPSRDWASVRLKFEEWGFLSLLKEKTWTKFTTTFDPLFGDTYVHTDASDDAVTDVGVST